MLNGARKICTNEDVLQDILFAEAKSLSRLPIIVSSHSTWLVILPSRQPISHACVIHAHCKGWTAHYMSCLWKGFNSSGLRNNCMQTFLVFTFLHHIIWWHRNSMDFLVRGGMIGEMIFTLMEGSKRCFDIGQVMTKSICPLHCPSIFFFFFCTFLHSKTNVELQVQLSKAFGWSCSLNTFGTTLEVQVFVAGVWNWERALFETFFCNRIATQLLSYSYKTYQHICIILKQRNKQLDTYL